MATQYYYLRDLGSTMIAAIAICGLFASAAVAESYSLPPAVHLGYNTSLSDTPRIDTKAVDSFTSKISLPPRRERRTTKKNLCEAECNCRSETAFLSVQCDLYKNQEYVFGSTNFIPSNSTSLLVKLASKARLTIVSDFFSDSRVNRILIEGKAEENEIHVEIRPNAFQNSKAPYPEIEIRNCHTLVLRANAIKGEFILNIANCHDVIIYPDALHNTKFKGNFSDITDLRIQERAFNKAQAYLSIYRSIIENLYRFEASLRQIGFYNCTIGNVTGGTFDVLNISAIIFDNCRIKTINTRAVTEKLYSDHLTIIGGYIGVIESEAIYGSGIVELILSNNHIESIQTNAIQVTAINASITKNRIIRTGLEWIRVKQWTKVIVSNNTFGEFDLMLLEKTNSKSVSCIFEKNLITHPLPGSLNFTNPYCMIREISFNRNCNCRIAWLEQLSSRDLRSESYCKLDENLKYCFNTKIINILKYQNEVCDLSSKTLDCLKNSGLKKIDGEFINPKELESDKEHNLHYIIGISIILCFLIAVTIITAFICVRKRRSSIATHNYEENPNQFSDGSKTFSKEDRRIINRTLETVKQKYSHDTYKDLEKHVQRLFKRNINETELVQSIGAIVQILNTCENSGDSFVAFTAILGKLLRPNDDASLDPVYAEPNLPEFNGRNAGNDFPEGQTDTEHIYMEPNSVQQPLLNNEYASPADRNDITTLYTEPIANDRDHQIIPPYATVVPKQMLNNNTTTNRLIQQPSTSKNLPDVLNSASLSSSIPSNNNKQQMTNVKKLAQNFANNPNFHITRSPTTNRRIPKYTIPNVKGKIAAGDQEAPRSDHSPISDSRSNHSGSSDITVKIDDIDIDYVDA